MSETETALPITGRYRFELDDFIALNKALQPLSPYRILIFLLAWLCIMGLVIGLASGSWEEFVIALADLFQFRNVPPVIYLFLAIGPVAILFSPLLRQWQIRRVYRNSATAGLDVLLEVDARGVRSSSAGREANLDWSVIREVRETPERLFLLLSRREALVVPRRAFADERTFQAAAEMARRGVAGAVKA